MGLTAKFWAVVLVATLLCLTLGLMAWRLQVSGVSEMAEASAETIHRASVENEERRALTMAKLIADTIVNPLYYFDLVALGETAGSASIQPGVAYVLIYDADGRIVHDGSNDIARFGQRMGDELATEAIAATEPRLQTMDGIIDATVPIHLGRENIGGVRVGISLSSPADFESQAATAVHAHGARQQRHMLGVAAILLVCLLVLVFITAWFVSRSLVRPVQRLAQLARQMGQGDYPDDWPQSSRRDEIGELERAFANMIENVERHNRDIRRLAFDDSLTGLPNRLAFREALDGQVAEAEKNGQQLAILLVDLDDFKRINDTLGHDAGDKVLIEFATRIRRVLEAMAPADAHAARFGGDEFIMLLSGRELREPAARLAQALLAELRQPISLGTQPMVLAASVGISLYPQHARQSSSLLKNADIAMHRAKLDGKNCFRFYTRGMDAAVEYQMRMEQDLRVALEQNELSVEYQPICSISNRRVVGAEALVRWRHPQRGPISPAEFIPVAEQTDQIDAIGRFVLRTACQDAAAWAQEGKPLSVSVNISARQLQRGNLPDIVEQELRRSGLAAENLHLELTETAMFSHETEAISVSARLRALGVKVWLDDFGTGFSGLSHLRRVPVDGVKIDRSFVADMLDDPDDLALTAAIIAMAHSLGIVVTAEGVETRGQYDALQARGCDYAQGYWLGRAMTATDFLGRLRKDGVSCEPVDASE